MRLAEGAKPWLILPGIGSLISLILTILSQDAVSYTHLRAHET